MVITEAMHLDYNDWAVTTATIFNALGLGGSKARKRHSLLQRNLIDWMLQSNSSKLLGTDMKPI